MDFILAEDNSELDSIFKISFDFEKLKSVLVKL